MSRLKLIGVRDVIQMELQDDYKVPHQLLTKLMDEDWVIQIIRTDGSKSWTARPDVIQEFLEDAKRVAL
jgi:hypothetical protein